MTPQGGSKRGFSTRIRRPGDASDEPGLDAIIDGQENEFTELTGDLKQNDRRRYRLQKQRLHELKYLIENKLIDEGDPDYK